MLRRSFLRIGCLVLLINDFVDIWFEARGGCGGGRAGAPAAAERRRVLCGGGGAQGAKMANYAIAKSVSTGFYLAFCATWLALRQIWCPFWVMWSCMFESWTLVRTYGPNVTNVTVWGAFNALLWVLQLQHTYWFVFIVAKARLDSTHQASPVRFSHPRYKRRPQPSCVRVRPLPPPPPPLKVRVNVSITVAGRREEDEFLDDYDAPD